MRPLRHHVFRLLRRAGGGVGWPVRQVIGVQGWARLGGCPGEVPQPRSGKEQAAAQAQEPASPASLLGGALKVSC